jgi:long-chain acyl-CoA synthetase
MRMASDLDLRLSAIMDELTAPGGPLETVPIARFGRELPILKHAPPTLGAYFAYYCDKHAELPFLVDHEVRLSFAETYACAREVAGGLVQGHGLQRGERVGIAARNSASWVVAYMAVLMAGGCAALLNAFESGEEIAAQARLVGCRLVLADDKRAARLDGHDHGAILLPLADGDPRHGLAALTAHGGGGETPLPALGPDDLATVVFTSGSTGRSKGAYSDHRAVVHAAMSYAAQSLMMLTQLTEVGRAPTTQPSTLVNVPLFHVTGEIPVLLQSFALGRKLAIMARWDAETAMRLIERETATYFVGVPLMSIEIANHPNRDAYDLSSCVNFAAGGAPRPVDHVARLRQALPHAFPIIGYGLTETNAVGCGNFNENYLAKPGSTGRASRPLVEVAILDDAGDALASGETGEIAIRTICNVTGYWDDTEATEAAFMPDGFFRTGDVGYLDADDYLFIVDRKKDIIIRGGENIACAEVEAAIYAHPAIAEASVFGLPDGRLGEVPAAAWLAKPGQGLDEGALRTFLGERLAAYKIPAFFFEEREQLPRLGTEKVDKRALQARYSQAGASATAAE